MEGLKGGELGLGLVWDSVGARAVRFHGLVKKSWADCFAGKSELEGA